MMKLTKKLLIASLSIAMVCSLFVGVFSFGEKSVNASETVQGASNAITYKLSEELGKIGYTDEELTASGWDGKTSNVQKRSLFEIAYKKSAIEIYSAGTNASISPKYVPKQYYEWAGDGNAWLFSWTNAAGLSSGSNMGSNVQINKSGTHVIYSGSNGLVWAFALAAPEKGTITIPEHTLRVGAHYSSAKALKIGFFKSSTVPSSFDPANSELNLVSYESIADYTIEEQSFAVEKGERVFIALYSDTQGDLVSDARTTITYNPTFVFEKEEVEVNYISYKLSEELSKIGLTDEELAASGWDGKYPSNPSEAKRNALKTAFEKSAIEIYGAAGIHPSTPFVAKYYYDWANDGNSSWFSYNRVAGLSAGIHTSSNQCIDKDNTHTVFAGKNGLVWGFAYVVPADGTVTVPEHTVNVTAFAASAKAIRIGYSKSNTQLTVLNPNDESLNMVSYGSGKHTIAEQTFEVKKGDRIYITLFSDTQGDWVSDSRTAITWDPSFVFEKYVEPEIPEEETVKLTEEIAKITLTDAELEAAGWDGTTPRTAGKEAALKTAFGKSAIKFYTASGYTGQNYAQKEYYKWSNTDWDWLFSYTKVNELGAGNAVPNKDNPRFTSNGTHMLYSRDATYHIVWAIGYKAPQDGVVTIPAHELILNYFTNTDGLFIGFSKGEASRASINPADASLNFVKYTTTGTSASPERKVISFEDQTFNVRKGEVVYINIYCNPTGSDARASITWNPSFHFVAGEYVEPEIPEEEGVIEYTFADEIGKIAYTEEEKTASGWNGSSRDANKQALYGVAFAKSAFKVYGAASASEVASTYTVKEYHTWMMNGNSWKWSSTAVNSLCAGNNYWNELGWAADGNHRVYAANHSNSWIFELTAPEKGTITIPAHQLKVTQVSTGASLKLGISLGNYILPSNADAAWATYGVGTYEIAEITFNVNKGDKLYISAYVEGDQKGRAVHVTWNPTFKFVTDPCVLHGHTEVVDAAKAPTCTEPGLTEGKHCSACNEVLVAQEVVAALGHSGEVEEEGYAPTCTEPGLTDKMTCSVCGESFEQEVIDALGHDIVNHEAKAPTCTEIGWDAYETCSRCDYSTYVEKAALGHDMAQATCTLPATCSVCGHTEGEALGHDIVNHEAKAPTCTEIGWDAYETCSRCDYSTYVEKAALGHDMAEATCVEPKTCKNGCGYTEGEALGHIEVVDEAVAPTCTQTGLTEGKHCGRCEEVLVAQEVVDALGHTMAPATCTLPATCSVCGHTEGSALGHVWEPATCLLPSTCSTCGETKGEALGHDMAPATCTQPSTCVNGCGLTEGDVIEHVYGEWEVVKAPTHLEEGLQKKACVHCGHEVEEVLPIDKNADLATCNGSIGGSGLCLLLAAISGAIIIRKKRG